MVKYIPLSAVSGYGVTFLRGNDELKVVSVIFVPMTDNVNI